MRTLRMTVCVWMRMRRAYRTLNANGVRDTHAHNVRQKDKSFMAGSPKMKWNDVFLLIFPPNDDDDDDTQFPFAWIPFLSFAAKSTTTTQNESLTLEWQRSPVNAMTHFGFAFPFSSFGWQKHPLFTWFNWKKWCFESDERRHPSPNEKKKTKMKRISTKLISKSFLPSPVRSFFLISLNAWQASCAHIYFHPNKLQFFWQRKPERKEKKRESNERTLRCLPVPFILVRRAIAIVSHLFCPMQSHTLEPKETESTSDIEGRTGEQKQNRHWIRINLLMDFSQLEPIPISISSVLCHRDRVR